MLVECPNCEKVVEAEVKGSVDCDNEWMTETYCLLCCPKCAKPLLVVYNDLTIEDEDPFRLYPPQLKRPHHTWPKSVIVSYEEAVRCLQAKSYTAAAIMCRKTIECVCHEKKAVGKSLQQKLNDLKANGVIESMLYEWADALRLMGNDAAHEPDTVFAKQDAVDMLEFTDALLGYVFTFREKFSAFQQRRLLTGAASSG
ncbi:MAG: DUF4145 domain-containing protein [Armatimonadota bacterium]